MTVRVAAVLLLSGAGAFGTVTVASAAPCDAYSQVCPSTPPTGIGGNTGGGAQQPVANPVEGRTDSPGSALPFTGGELVLYSTVGLAAIAGGTAFVVAGRRRNRAEV